MNSELSLESHVPPHPAEDAAISEESLDGWADGLPLQVWTAAPDGALEYVSRRVAEYVGTPRDELLRDGWATFLHEDDVDATIDKWRASLESGDRYDAQFRLRRADGAYRWHVAQALPVRATDGEIVRWIGTNTDVDDQARAKEALVRSESRMAFLAEASRQLSDSLEFEETLRNVARLAVPEFADWCAVDLLENGNLVRVAVEHPDPERIRLAIELAERYPPDPDAPSGVRNVLRTGKAEWLAEIPPDLIQAAAVDDDHRRLLESLELRSYIVAPLAARDEVLGAMTFVFAESDRRYQESDVGFVEDLARRAATAIVNSRLVRELRETQTLLEEQALELQAQAAHVDEQAIELELSNDELQTTVDRLGRSESLLEEAQAAAHLGSWEWDIAANSVTWTDELYRLFGVEPVGAPVTFQSYLDRIHEEDLELTNATIQASFAEGKPFTFDHRIVRPDGSVRHLHCRGRVITAPDGSPVKMRGSAQDVTEEREVRVELDRARLEAEEANRAKSEFLASMSHELRTPLNAIAGHLELVEMGIYGPVTDKQKHSLSRIRTNQQHLLRLINDVLQFAKIEAGRLEIRDDPFPVGRVIAETANLLGPQAIAHGLRCDVPRVDDDLEVLGDEERVRQILVNLISNAIKFTPDGGTISIAAENRDGHVRVLVSDTGVGIPASMHDAIFDPFVQAGREPGASTQGVGLGLAISRDLARSMGGDLAVESEPGSGSTFTLTLRAPEPTAT